MTQAVTVANIAAYYLMEHAQLGQRGSTYGSSMLIGTLSFPRVGNRQLLSGPKQAEIIADRVRENSPDLLLTAGHSLKDMDDLEWLLEHVPANRTTLLVEVENDRLSMLELAAVPPLSQHAMYAVFPSRKFMRLGPQIFARSGEASEIIGSRFCNALSGRSFEVFGMKCIALCCGELNMLAGRDRVQFRFPAASALIEGADIVLNPTHDRMGNAGTVIAKRKFLSEPIGMRPRTYISASNWNLQTKAGAQRQDSQTLHTVFHNGSQFKVERVASSRDFEYREAVL